MLQADFDAITDVYLRKASGTGPVALTDVEVAAVRIAESHVDGTLILELL